MAPGDIEVRGNRRELFLKIGLFFVFAKAHFGKRFCTWINLVFCNEEWNSVSKWRWKTQLIQLLL